MAVARAVRVGCVVLGCLLAGTAYGQDDKNARRFKDEDVERAKAFWIQNATGGNSLDCLLTLNKALRILYDDPAMKVSSTIDRTMNGLNKIGRATEVLHMGFFDEKGRKTFGVTEPKTLRKSVWDHMIAQAGSEPGYYMFGLSPLDGIHSVVLTLDTHDPEDPKVYWSDQWSSKGGWKLYPTKKDLDGEIEYRTNRWWKSELSSKKIKFKSDAKVWQLLPRVEQVKTLQATVIRASHLNLRSEPTSSKQNHVKDSRGRRRYAKKGETFEVVGRQGKWVQLKLSDGTEAWAHGYFLEVKEVLKAIAETSGITARISQD